MAIEIKFPLHLKNTKTNIFYEVISLKSSITVNDNQFGIVIKRLINDPVASSVLEEYFQLPDQFIKISPEEFAVALDNAIISITTVEPKTEENAGD